MTWYWWVAGYVVVALLFAGIHAAIEDAKEMDKVVRARAAGEKVDVDKAMREFRERPQGGNVVAGFLWPFTILLNLAAIPMALARGLAFLPWLKRRVEKSKRDAALRELGEEERE